MARPRIGALDEDLEEPRRRADGEAIEFCELHPRAIRRGAAERAEQHGDARGDRHEHARAPERDARGGF